MRGASGTDEPAANYGKRPPWSVPGVDMPTIGNLQLAISFGRTTPLSPNVTKDPARHGCIRTRLLNDLQGRPILLLGSLSLSAATQQYDNCLIKEDHMAMRMFSPVFVKAGNSLVEEIACLEDALG